jgi:peptide deformylase
MIKKIIKYPNPSLRKSTELLNFPVDDVIIEHVKDLQDTLHDDPMGLAIASNQILHSGFRLFVVRDDKKLNDIFPGGVVINPEWCVDSDNVVTEREGCLSFPGMTFDIPRYEKIRVIFFDIDGAQHDKVVEGVVAQMVQHEVDHLEGKLFIEYLPKKAQISVRNSVIARKKSGRW